MERRGEQEMGNNSMGYTPAQESAVKLPLAPIFSTPPDRRSNAAALSTRRGSSIFSPNQTLDHPYIPLPLPPPPHHDAVSPDPDPTSPAPSNSKYPALPPPPTAIRYKECLRNHAASMGAHVLDGCGEFMPGGDDGTLESLKCAACSCHRNFHRKETDGEPQPPLSNHRNHNPSSRNNRRARRTPQHSSPAPHLKRHFATAMVSFGGGAAAESSSEGLNRFQSGGAAGGPSFSKKRFRTKFSQEQKDRMHDFATRIEWRIQKQDEEEVQRFCGEVGVKRQVFKVWMHNNKQAMKKREISDD